MQLPSPEAEPIPDVDIERFIRQSGPEASVHRLVLTRALRPDRMEAAVLQCCRNLAWIKPLRRVALQPEAQVLTVLGGLRGKPGPLQNRQAGELPKSPGPDLFTVLELDETDGAGGSLAAASLMTPQMVTLTGTSSGAIPKDSYLVEMQAKMGYALLPSTAMPGIGADTVSEDRINAISSASVLAAEAGSYRPVLVLLPPGSENPRLSLETAARKAQSTLLVAPVGGGSASEMSGLVKGAAREGVWLLLENCHLDPASTAGLIPILK